MKTQILILFVLLSAIGYAQNGINYKALIKDDNGNTVANTTIQIQFTIVQDVTNVYTEMHSPTTDANGIVIVNIGEGTVTSGNFNTINWATTNHSLNVQIDTGNGLVDLGTTQFMSVPYAKYAETTNNASNVSGLEAIDEGNGIGWRLIGVNLDSYGDIGLNAVDLSHTISDENSGALGQSSFSSGFRSIASGLASTALGNLTSATNLASTALGSGTEALADNSLATGFRSTAIGFASTAIGNDTDAIGYSSTAMGISTDAEAYNSTAIGRYNIGGGNPTSWLDNDPLFEIGNGTSDSNRSNALTVSKSGLHTINSSSTGLSIDADSYGIAIFNSGNNAIQINNPGNNGIAISGAVDDGITITADDDGIVISADDDGARIVGRNLGVYASGGQLQSDIPDIILGSSSNSSFSDDGIISTNPLRASSDMFLRSYDAVVVDLDYDNNEAGNFRVRNGNQEVVFDVTEAGNVNIEGRLRIGDETIEDTGANRLEFDAHLIPSSDTNFLLGLSTSRWNAVYATNGVIATSDRREKKNIENLNYGLKEVLQMQPVSFNWKNKNNPDTKLGLIAQDVLELVPEVVKTHTWEKDKVSGVLTKKELDRLGVYYSDLIPVLIKAIQEQQGIINNQKNINLQQKIELQKLNRNFEALLSRIEILETNNSN